MTSAFAVSRAPSGAVTATLTDDVPPAACRCSKRLNATWSLCGEAATTGHACGCVDVPCTAAVVLTPATPNIACPSNEAAASPISFPTTTALDIQLRCDPRHPARPFTRSRVSTQVE